MESNTKPDMENVSEEVIAETTPQIGEQQSVTPNAEAVSEETAEEKHSIKYNGEIFELTLEELKTAAQKGMNYDKILDERDRLKTSREFKILDARAAAEGLTREQYLDRLESGAESSEEAELISLGMPLSLAKEHIRLKNAVKETKPYANEGEVDRNKDEELKKRLSEFKKLYPEITRLPDEVVEDIKSGTDIIIAYQKYEIGNLKRAAAAAERNLQNREKSVGSLSDTGTSGGRYFSEAELDYMLKSNGKKLMDDEIWEKAVRSMAFHQKKKKG